MKPVVGSEQGGVRPVLIIQNNAGKRYGSTVIVAAMSRKITKKADLPTYYKVRAYVGLKGELLVLLEYIQTIDKKRLSDYIGRLGKKDMGQFDRCFTVNLALKNRRTERS